MANQIPDMLSTEQLFVGLVISISNAAMIALGKMTDPSEEKAEINLEMAKLNIDMLEMLMTKTNGNLTEMEDTLLTTTLTNLRMNYVREVK